MSLSSVTYVTWPDFSSYTLSEQKGYKNSLPFGVVARANQTVAAWPDSIDILVDNILLIYLSASCRGFRVPFV